MKKGTYVSRSAFTKTSEECKRLKLDIYKIVMKADRDVIKKWQDKFEQDEKFVAMIREICLRQPRTDIRQE